MFKAKYIVIDFDTPIVFPETLTHAELARKVSALKVTSAGFVYIENGSYHCYGESISLKVKSNPEADNRILNKFLGGDVE